MDVIFATGNENKLKEIKAVLEGTGLSVISMKEAGVFRDIDETGTTFEENALIKAETIRNATGKLTLADDSGLVIDALGGEPGIYSSRYLGEDTPYDVKNGIILERMADVPEEKRSARFVCAIAIAYPDGTSEVVRGVMEGRIAYEIAGENGFGYDPIFFLPKMGCTSAEIPMEEKNAISHRGKGLRLMKERLAARGLI